MRLPCICRKGRWVAVFGSGGWEIVGLDSGYVIGGVLSFDWESVLRVSCRQKEARTVTLQT
jgi:hypothetical protein